MGDTEENKDADNQQVEERAFTFEEYLEAYAPKDDKSGDLQDDAENVAVAMANETIRILKSRIALM